MKFLVITGLLLLTAACAAAPPIAAGPDPADPNVAVAPARYTSGLAAYRSQRPVEPGAWTDTNERVTPQPKSGQ